ncbi:MAG: helix-turn-helix transcriptional regulator [Bacteroidetes bacterium]|nr:helix-turn-helix transcriptional regulator [Bacteroidota bacterium]
MPDFIYNGKIYYNPVEFAMDQIGGTWKMPILWRLKGRKMRYSELQKDIPHITQKMLSTQLKELEKNGFITKKVFPTVPPKTEYALTAKGKRAIAVITVIREYGLELMKESGTTHRSAGE